MRRTFTAAEFENLYRATVRDLFAYVRRRSGHDAEETVAEVFAVAWRRRDDLPDPAHRRAWLFGVARTLLLAAGRLRQRESGLVHALSSQPVLGDGFDPGDETAGAVAAALGRLDPGQQEVLRLVAWEGLSSAELAVALGVRAGTARVRLHRARRALASDPEVRALVEGRGVQPRASTSSSV